MLIYSVNSGFISEPFYWLAWNRYLTTNRPL